MPKAASQRNSSRARASSMALAGILTRMAPLRWKRSGSWSKPLAVTLPAQPVWVSTLSTRPSFSVTVIGVPALASSRAFSITSQ